MTARMWLKKLITNEDDEDDDDESVLAADAAADRGAITRQRHHRGPALGAQSCAISAIRVHATDDVGRTMWSRSGRYHRSFGPRYQAATAVHSTIGRQQRPPWRGS